MDIKKLANEIKQGNVTSLARAITLIESHLAEDWQRAKELLLIFKDEKPKSRRLGFSGPPGVGKSTFIEKVGLEIIKKNQKVAVLAVDPSSEITGGSILGDKTRMEELSRQSLAFVRPSATRGHLGGVTSSLPGVIRLCEVAGYDWILVESVGVGQSEVELSRMVDFFTLISQPGAGDELQGIKKGILEYVNLIVVNKNDRDPKLVNITRQQYLAALKILRQQPVEVLACSALTGQGVDQVINIYEEFYKNFDWNVRFRMAEFWFESLVYSEFKKRLKNDPQLQKHFAELNQKVGRGQQLPVEAVEEFFADLKLN